MKKKTNFNATLILCADLHLREDQPECRTDDYFKAQHEKIKWLYNLKAEKGNPGVILCAGDIFHKAKVSKRFEIFCMKELPQMYCIPGNHDLPSHSINEIENSSIGILEGAGEIEIFKTPLDTIYKFESYGMKIGMIHSLLHRDNPVKVEGKIISTKAIKILKDNPDCDIILSGDNHQTFIEEWEGRFLFNPGSMMRMTAAQIEHEPCVILFDAKTKDYKYECFPFVGGEVSRNHIEKKEKHDERMSRFVENMNTDFSMDIDFVKNIELFTKKNKQRKPVQEELFSIIETAGGK